MNLEKRIEELEHRIGAKDDFMLLVISFLSCKQDKMGPERIIRHNVVGYSAVGRDRTWALQPGQSPDDLKASMQRELKAEGHKVYVVCECYEDTRGLAAKA